MSGGHFCNHGYPYYSVSQFADELENEIANNETPNGDDYCPKYEAETLAVLNAQIRLLRRAAEVMRAIDYLYAGDHSEGSFLESLRKLGDDPAQLATEALENVRALQTHVEVLREAHQSASREVGRLLAERQALADSAQSVEQNVCALLDLYHSRAVGAEKQAKLAWDRHAEKDAAYGEALRERDKAQEGVAMLREALKAYYHECQCQRRDMDKVNMQAYAALRATDGPEDKP